MGWARGDSASGSCPARSEGGIQRAIQTYHQRAPRAKQDTTTGRECFRGGSERHRTHGQQEAASNTGHPPGWGREARPKAGTPFRTKKNFGSVAKINFKLISLPTTSFFFSPYLSGPGRSSGRIGGIRLQLRVVGLPCSAQAAARPQGCSKAPVLSSCLAASAERGGALTLS